MQILQLDIVNSIYESIHIYPVNMPYDTAQVI